MADDLGGLGGMIEKHPYVVGMAVAVVALIAYMQSRETAPAAQSVSFAGGGAARGIDPEAAAISQSAIAAGSAGISTIAQLLAIQDTNHAALEGALANTFASRDVSLAATEAGRQASLADTEAGLRASLAQTEGQRDAALAASTASRDVGLAATSAAERAAQYNAEASIEAARVTAQIQTAQIQANARAGDQAAKNQEFAIQAAKDRQRAESNSNIWGSVLNFAGDILGFFGQGRQQTPTAPTPGYYSQGRR